MIDAWLVTNIAVGTLVGGFLFFATILVCDRVERYLAARKLAGEDDA
jgi:hypothetical protein